MTLTYAQSIDGCIAASKNQKLVLSGPTSMLMTHELRAMHQAILVGKGTVFADDPRLTARLSQDVRNPRPVVLDSKCTIRPTAALFKRQHTELLPIIYTAPLDGDGRARKNALEENTNAEVVSLRADKGTSVPLEKMLCNLYDKGVSTVMVEGGSRVITSFLEQSYLVDFVIVTICPKFVAGGVPSVVPQSSKGGNHLDLKNANWTVLGDDVIVSGSLRE